MMAADDLKPRDFTFLDMINAVDNVPQDSDLGTFYKLLLPRDPRPHGFMLHSVVSKMPWSPEFIIDHHLHTVQLLDVTGGKDTAKSCIASFKKTIDTAVDNDIFPMLHGEHSELYRIIGANYLVCLERFTAPLFGIATRGAHMTAYVRSSSGLKIWVPRRSEHLFSYPNKLDTTVAGGIKAEHSPLECILAEADEEASLPADFVKDNAVAAGIVTYVTRKTNTGLVYADVLYVFDIELPEGMIPKPQDGEVSEFYLWSVDEVKRAMLSQGFKPNCNLVMIDFFIRHGIITQENEDSYVEIASRLRRKLHVPTTPERLFESGRSDLL